MNRLKLQFSLLLIITTVVILAQEKDKDYSDALALIEIWLDAQRDYEQLPGLSAVIVKDQEILWSGAFGLANMEDGVKSETSTLYSICSISKLFTSVALMKLYDEGKIRLDDQIAELLPWYNLRQRYPDSGPITIRTLMTHSSGLPREADFPYWTGPEFPFPSSEQIKSTLADQETLYPSSTYFQYSNLGLTLLGEIVEVVSGSTYDEYVTQNIIIPLGLNDTRTELPESLYGQQLSIGYSPLTREGKMEKMNTFQANGIKPAAGFSSNVLDLASFASWQFRLLDTSTVEILKPSTLKYMQNVHWTDPDWETTWGLGFAVYKGSDGTKWVGHGGYCPGYKTTLQLNPGSKLAYSVMINSSGANPTKYVSGMHAILKKVKGEWDDSPDSNKKILSEYVGIYSMNYAELYVSTWEGNLVLLNLPSDSPAKSMTMYKHIEDDIFRRVREDGELGEALSFERDEAGSIYRFRKHQIYFTRANP